MCLVYKTKYYQRGLICRCCANIKKLESCQKKKKKRENWFVVLNACGQQLEFGGFTNWQVLSSPNIIPILQVGNYQSCPKKFVMEFH